MGTNDLSPYAAIVAGCILVRVYSANSGLFLRYATPDEVDRFYLGQTEMDRAAVVKYHSTAFVSRVYFPSENIYMDKEWVSRPVRVDENPFLDKKACLG